MINSLSGDIYLTVNHVYLPRYTYLQKHLNSSIIQDLCIRIVRDIPKVKLHHIIGC